MTQPVVVQVRINTPTAAIARQAALEKGIQINRVKQRDDCAQLYGSWVIQTEQMAVVLTEQEKDRLFRDTEKILGGSPIVSAGVRPYPE